MTADNLICFSAGNDFGGPSAPNAYAPGQFASPPPKKSGWWKWLLGGLGCGGILLVLCCGGLTYWGYSFGMGMLTQSLREEIAGNPKVEEHLGEINSIQPNLVETGGEKKARGGSGNWMVMDANGTKGNGKFIVETAPQPQPGNMFNTIELRLPTGETIPIKP